MSAQMTEAGAAARPAQADAAETPTGAGALLDRPLRVAHLFPELLNLYGDGGNILTLACRCRWRGIPVEVVPVHLGQTPSFSDVDVVLIGGGSDREQSIVCTRLRSVQADLRDYVEDGGVLLAVCGGYQLLGHSYLLGERRLEGLSLVDLDTDRGDPRLVGNIEVASPIQDMPVVGYENHAGRTRLGPGVEPLGKVVHGAGNDGVSGQEGCLYKNVVGTYIHGPLLPKNPGVADWLLARALGRRLGGDVELPALPDREEREANAVMCRRMEAGER